MESRNPGMTPGRLGTCWLAWRGFLRSGYDARPRPAFDFRQEWPRLPYTLFLAARCGKVSYSVFAWRVAGEVEKTARAAC